MRIRSRLACLVLLATLASSTHAITADLTSGTAGQLFLNQSFNETRGATAQVLGGVDLALLSMRLDGLDILLPGGTVGARVYANATGTLLASANQAVSAGMNQSVTVPISATLAAGASYRFAFFVSDPPNGGAGDMFDPAPAGMLAFAPFVESSGLFRVADAWSIGSDSFPTNPNGFLPRLTLEVRPVPEPGLLGLLVAGLVPLGLIVARRCRID